MHYRKPHYYDDFVCIADQCPDTCCAGWEIVIDEQSLDKYETISGKFGDRLHKSINWKEGVFKQENRRCAFLNKQNLCDIYTKLGPEYFCDTCRIYPRHTEEFDGLREFSLSLSCPVAAKIILGHKGPINFIEEDDHVLEREDDYEDFDFLLFDWLEVAREKLFQVIENKTYSMKARMAVILDFSYLAQTAFDHGTLLELDIDYEIEKATARAVEFMNHENFSKGFEYKKVMLNDLKKLEVLREEWSDFLSDLEKNLYEIDLETYRNIKSKFQQYLRQLPEKNEQFDSIKEQLLSFFLYTYFCGAVYDDMIYTKAVLAVFSVLWIEELCVDTWLIKEGRLEFKDCVQISYQYAREIEHSDDNLLLLEEVFDTRSIYLPEKIKEIIGIS